MLRRSNVNRAMDIWMVCERKKLNPGIHISDFIHVHLACGEYEVIVRKGGSLERTPIVSVNTEKVVVIEVDNPSAKAPQRIDIRRT
jgi:hypothetical protein